jgi:phenylacetate-CoA ligase
MEPLLKPIMTEPIALHQDKAADSQKAALAVEALPEEKYPVFYNTRSINSLTDEIDALFWKRFYRRTICSWTLLRVRFWMNLSEERIQKAAQKLAVEAFKQALDVPAYADFVKGKKIERFSDIPIATKDNYIKPHMDGEKVLRLYLNGEIPHKAKRDTSTGTSGKSTSWWRGHHEQEIVERLTAYAAKVVTNDQPYSFINGFAVGPWATGITATLATNSDSRASIAIIGPNINELWETMKEHTVLWKDKEKPIIVGGYPPHIRAIVDKAHAEGFPMHKHNFIAIVGGEGMSEDMRDLIEVSVKKDDKGNPVRTGFRHCFSSIGASDLDINIGYESPFEVGLRKACHQNKALAEELFGKNQFIPMIFHYDPLNYLIETDEQQNMILTCVRMDRISPRIRYNLGDRGKVMPVSEVLKIVKKHNVTLPHQPNTNLPMLFVWGRQGSHISFRGCKVAPENLGEAIRRLDEKMPGLNSRIAHYGFYQYERNGRKNTEIVLEVVDNKDIDPLAHKEFLNELLKVLALVNFDFIEQIKHSPDDEKPVLRIFARGKSPMTLQQERYPMKKKQYIFTEGCEFIAHHDAMGEFSKTASIV